MQCDYLFTHPDNHKQTGLKGAGIVCNMTTNKPMQVQHSYWTAQCHTAQNKVHASLSLRLALPKLKWHLSNQLSMSELHWYYTYDACISGWGDFTELFWVVLVLVFSAWSLLMTIYSDRQIILRRIIITTWISSKASNAKKFNRLNVFKVWLLKYMLK